MDTGLVGFVTLAALILGLFAWLRRDNRALRDEMKGQRVETGELRERVARIEGLLEAVFMRRDLTPLPDPPASEPVRKSEAA